jgi:proteic killer suppression protein
MIQSFRERKTQRFFEGQRVRDFQGFADQAARRLAVLNSAESLQDLAALRSNRLEPLAGDRAGQYSIRINRQWRICFRWEEDGRHGVEIVDHHQ